MLENLSKQNFSAANSNKKDLYFSSVRDVRFDANPMGCSRLTTFPFDSLVENLCATDPPYP
jgi:hypothetical protein